MEVVVADLVLWTFRDEVDNVIISVHSEVTFVAVSAKVKTRQVSVETTMHRQQRSHCNKF